ncbi:hypothetical protein OUZ56_003174 [Daphnia magna]|uniref:Uncharacterized protein n=1 Tax=Daphnia magna TaxID=35525 RepID=A0ABR0A7Y9_9CRUS|nr:hypothetical protein OUZ56_003174 [Daphnia magna]
MESWTHLRGLDVPNVQPEDVGVLIGLDVAEAHDHMDSVKPPAGTIGPIAFKTPFGWCLGGQTGPPQDGRTFIAHIVSEESSEDLNELVKNSGSWRRKTLTWNSLFSTKTIIVTSIQRQQIASDETSTLTTTSTPSIPKTGQKVISALREFCLASPTLDLDLEKLPIVQTLGVMSNGKTDMLTFKIV